MVGIWFWFGLVAAIGFVGWMAFTWWKGSFTKIFMGPRIIGIMLGIEVIGLFLMIVALIMVIGNPANAATPVMLQIGLLFAIPAGIYLIIFLLNRTLQLDKSFDISTVDSAWFDDRATENTERDQKAVLLIAEMEEQLSLNKEKVKELETELEAKNREIESFIATHPTPEGGELSPEDLAELTQLRAQKDELEGKLGEISKEQARIAEEKAELIKEREIFAAEKERLAADKAKFETLQEQFKNAAGDESNPALAEEFAKQLEELKDQQKAKLEELESELENARFQLVNSDTHELAKRETELLGELDYLKNKLNKEVAAREAIEAEKEELKTYVTKDPQISDDNLALHNDLSEALKRIEFLENEKYLKYLRDRERRAALAAYRKEVLSQENVNAHMRKYFVEVAACFIMDRETFKDKFGLSPYNRITMSQITETGKQRVQHTMTSTKRKLYSFAETLVDVDRFFVHPILYPSFVHLAKEGTSMVRMSEKLYKIYLDNCRKDFVKDYRYKEDFENMLILVSNHYLIRHINFKKIFTNVPFAVKSKLADPEIVHYLGNKDLIKKFKKAMPHYSDLGFENLYQALTIAFTASRLEKLSDEMIYEIILKDGARVAKTLYKAKDAQSWMDGEEHNLDIANDAGHMVEEITIPSDDTSDSVA